MSPQDSQGLSSMTLYSPKASDIPCSMLCRCTGCLSIHLCIASITSFLSVGVMLISSLPSTLIEKAMQPDTLCTIINLLINLVGEKGIEPKSSRTYQKGHFMRLVDFPRLSLALYATVTSSPKVVGFPPTPHSS